MVIINGFHGILLGWQKWDDCYGIWGFFMGFFMGIQWDSRYCFYQLIWEIYWLIKDSIMGWDGIQVFSRLLRGFPPWKPFISYHENKFGCPAVPRSYPKNKSNGCLQGLCEQHYRYGYLNNGYGINMIAYRYVSRSSNKMRDIVKAVDERSMVIHPIISDFSKWVH